jgi:hypothetical protein
MRIGQQNDYLRSFLELSDEYLRTFPNPTNIFAAFTSRKCLDVSSGYCWSQCNSVVGAKRLDCLTKIGTVAIAFSAVDAMTMELVRRIEAAANPSDGVDDAQQYLDSRKTEIAGKMGVLKSLRGDQVSDETKRKLVSRLAEDASKVGDLQVKYISHSISNPAFKAKLDKLVGDYQTLLTQ